MAKNSSLFAHWTYWMGVTLYGFLAASRHFDAPAWEAYSLHSIEQIVAYDTYGQWDKKNYHYTLINTQFYWLDELDDCGSFGSLMLESLNYKANEQILPIAERIAAFIENDVIRQPDRAFYRKDDTMWVDDLYMSIPYLVRYWELSQEEKFIEDAIDQMLLFKQRFFLPEKGIMSHIYDTMYYKANQIPWSRGNGWVIFSLSELLNKLPESNPRRAELVAFFNELAIGLMNYQDQDGLWHQVIDDPTTYQESSCTAMFICALSRGVVNGYLTDKLQEAVIETIKNAWNGLITHCIDKDGNLYGVCRGSGHSFSRPYYHGLGWLLNDPHGIGIVALAGVEYEKVKHFAE